MAAASKRKSLIIVHRREKGFVPKPLTHLPQNCIFMIEKAVYCSDR
jgi:hypothetical protein